MAERNVIKGFDYVKSIEGMQNILSQNYGHEIRRLHVSKPQMIDNIVAETECSSISTVRPWNYADFLCRVKTFRPFHWFAKPDTISPLRCARLGWYNKAKNTLCCGSCGVDLQHDSDDVDGTRLYRDMITSHKSELCGWVSDNGTYNFSPTTFLQFADSDVNSVLDGVRTRLGDWQEALGTCTHIASSRDCSESAENSSNSSSSGCDTSFQHSYPPKDLQNWENAWKLLRPLLDPSVPSSLSINSSDASKLREFLLGLLRNRSKLSSSLVGASKGQQQVTGKSTVAELFPQALLLTMFGWEYGPSDGRAHCSLCARSFKVHQLSSLPSATCTTTSTASSKTSAIDVSSQSSPEMRSDVVKEHRYYCPWVGPYVAQPDLDALCADDEGKSASTDAVALRTEPVPDAQGERGDGRVDSLPGWCIVLEVLLSCSLGPEVACGVMDNCPYQLKNTSGDTSNKWVHTSSTPDRKRSSGEACYPTPSSTGSCGSGSGVSSKRKSVGISGNDSSGADDGMSNAEVDIGGACATASGYGGSPTSGADREKSSGGAVYKKIKHVLDMIDK